MAALERLDTWGAQTTYPLVMHLFDLQERQQATTQEVLESLIYVESFLVRRMLCGVYSGNLNRIFNAVIKQLEGYEIPAAAWESDVLAARLNDYDPHWLDSLCLAGPALWAMPPSGPFHVMIAPTTPTGSRTSSQPTESKRPRLTTYPSS